MNKIETKPLFNCYPYSSGLYNNCGYLMIDSNQKKINLYKNNMDFLFEQNTRDAYYSICLYGDSYIVSKQNVKEKLYKINMFFKEYEEIKLNVPKEYLDTIVCVCYDAANMKILIATNYRVYSVSLDGYFIKDEYDYNNRLFNSPLFIKGIDGCCKQCLKKSQIT